MATLEELERKIKLIEDRNKKVEADKAWETSKTRRLLLIIFTYIVIGSFMDGMGIDEPWKNAIVPSIGFLLSTLSLPLIKEFWLKYIYKKRP